MTLSGTIQMTLRGREASTTPAHAAATATSVTCELVERRCTRR
jgi:hypothetical protein